MKTAIKAAIRLYQGLISPLFPAACRFEPSCSEYAAQAVERHGVVRGLRMAARRILRCHPFSGKFGYDPID